MARWSSPRAPSLSGTLPKPKPAATSAQVQARDKPACEKGVLMHMDSSPCGYSEKDNKAIAGEIPGTDTQHKKTQESSARNTFSRPPPWSTGSERKGEKHPTLLPAEFRIHKDKCSSESWSPTAKSANTSCSRSLPARTRRRGRRPRPITCRAV
jgi:hypothetical protein